MPKNKQVSFVWGHLNMVCAKFDEYLIKCVQKKATFQLKWNALYKNSKRLLGKL